MGTARPSFLQALLEETFSHSGPTAQEVDDIKGAAGVIFAGGFPPLAERFSEF